MAKTKAIHTYTSDISHSEKKFAFMGNENFLRQERNISLVSDKLVDREVGVDYKEILPTET